MACGVHRSYPQDGRFNHRDLNNFVPRVLGYPPDAATAEHGLRVMGVVRAETQPAIDARGLAPACGPVLLLGNLDGPIQATDEMLGRAMMELPPGSVILVEAQTWEVGLGGIQRYVPSEYEDPVFDAICACAWFGLTVVEAAGNQSVFLDEVQYDDGTYPFDRNAWDSGAILVAAGTWSHTWSRLYESNYGSRVDCFAEGMHVGTLSGSSTTREFGYTSAATAIVAGVAASVQGMALQQRGRVLHPLALRELLKEGRAYPEIGVMPDLPKIAARLPGLPDIYFL